MNSSRESNHPHALIRVVAVPVPAKNIFVKGTMRTSADGRWPPVYLSICVHFNWTPTAFLFCRLRPKLLDADIRKNLDSDGQKFFGRGRPENLAADGQNKWSSASI